MQDNIIIKTKGESFVVHPKDEEDYQKIMGMLAHNIRAKYCIRNQFGMFISLGEADMSWVSTYDVNTLHLYPKGIVEYDMFGNRSEKDQVGNRTVVLTHDGIISKYRYDFRLKMTRSHYDQMNLPINVWERLSKQEKTEIILSMSPSELARHRDKMSGRYKR
jgi:hypothetical protein